MTGATRRGRIAGTAALALAAGLLPVAGCTLSHPPAAAAPTSGVGAGATASVPGAVTAPVSRPPVPGVDGDRYPRNVTPGSTCSSAGALGFTAKVAPIHCSTSAADPHLRWRAP